MKQWKDNNLSALMEYPFDFGRFIEKRIREIDDLDERRFAKKILAEGIGKVIQETEEKYSRLERRIYEELKVEENQYETAMTVINRKHYDPANETLYPVIEEDLNPDKLAASLSGDEWIWEDTVFLAVSEEKQREFESMGEFSGVIEGDGEKGEAVFRAEPAKRYRNVMEGLYKIFQDNHIPWETVNTAYLDKFYDIYRRNLHGSGSGRITPQESPASSDIPESAFGLPGKLHIDFGKFTEAVRYGMIPLWNIERVKFDSADFMLPCTGGMYYEHEFYLGDKEEQDGYLIETNEEILEIRHEKKKIVMKSLKETFENWQALHMIQKKSRLSLDYTAPLLTNHKNDSFIRRFSENSRITLMTKTDLFRRIMELDIRDYVEIAGYKIVDHASAYPKAETMNWFVKDELFPMESRKVLLLEFKERQPGHYLNDGMIRFVISQMQLEISEYRCVGVVI